MFDIINLELVNLLISYMGTQIPEFLKIDKFKFSIDCFLIFCIY